MFSKVLAAVAVFVGLFFVMDALLTMSEQEDCARLESQIEQGYVEALPDWCAEVEGR